MATHRLKTAALLLLTLVWSSTPAACGRVTIYHYSRLQMGTLINLSLICESEDRALRAADAAFDAIEKVEALMSPARKDSDLSRINRMAAKGPVMVAPETLRVIQKSLEVSRETGGAFDISFAGLGALWDFKNPSFRPPDRTALAGKLPLVNYNNIIISENSRSVRFKRQGMKIGLGGIAKGYAISKAVAALQNEGVRAFIVDAGGDLTVGGTKFGKEWRVGIRHPRKEGVLGALTLDDGESIVTSGDYECFVIHHGVRYHHILDPKTGFPTRTFSSVTVIGSDPTLIDARATALFVMGGVRAREFLKSHPGLKAVLVDLDMKIAASKELKGRIEWLEKVEVQWF